METKKNNVVLIVIIVFISIFMFSGGVLGTYYYFKHNPNKVIENITKTEKEVTVNEKGIADSVEKVYDSVVTVVNYKNNKAYASGTGFVYKTKDDVAYILTNYHVINGANKVTVTFTNDKLIEAKVVGGDLYADVAVLSVSKSDIISTASMGSNENVRIGDTAFAVGSPVSSSYGWTVTRGIISGKDRTVSVNISDNGLNNDSAVMNVIQTDVAINSGNSGGPLCNSNGEVIGITSSKVSSTGVEGIGFAIPIEDALNIANKVENGEEIVRPYIGINMSELVVAKYYGYTSTEEDTGVYISDVVDDSPAMKAGIRKGDIILEVDGKKVDSVATFRYLLYKHEVGEIANIKIDRNKSKVDITVKLGTNS